ncbi:hypothetical protein [Pararhodobacter zhoushanensis]|uniref:hypothetical protein n=1 Tax=Pararhodobacter zhoushanensis TaxID=2479545 RepID=UPI000F8E49AA|nr:hypothetical protein [Pararhodobacter zhoushanensis]
MIWLLRVIAGPLVWAAGFSAVYALHGIGCARGWPGVITPLGTLHDGALIGALVVALIAATLIFVRRPRPPMAPEDRLIAYGAWIGLISVAFTLFPVIAVNTCSVTGT